MRSFAITSVEYLREGADVIMGLLGVSVIGTGEMSLAFPNRFERLNH
jgi:hypothetical protein